MIKSSDLKARLTWLYAVQLGQLSSVELRRYKHPLSKDLLQGPLTEVSFFQKRYSQILVDGNAKLLKGCL